MSKPHIRAMYCCNPPRVIVGWATPLWAIGDLAAAMRIVLHGVVPSNAIKLRPGNMWSPRGGQ